MKRIAVFSLPLFVLLLLGRQQPINEIYLIPHGFHGYVAVVFEVKEGEKEIFEDDWRVYQIPEDGILLTQAKFNHTMHQEKNFFVTEGKRTKIPESDQIEPDALKAKGIKDDDVFFHGDGSSGVADFYFVDSFVGTYKEFKATPQDFMPITFRQRIADKLTRITGKKVSL
jgi:hypothetical protein